MCQSGGGIGHLDLLIGERYVFWFSIDTGIMTHLRSYVNMDYMFFSSIQQSEHLIIVVSYDIACQWSIHLWEQMKMYPHWMHTDSNGKSFHFLVLKFHLPAHVMACQTVFSFNFNRHVGRTDGEAPERGWAQINPVATSTAEMGPGHRRNTLDDHFGDGNWKKTTLMGLLVPLPS